MKAVLDVDNGSDTPTPTDSFRNYRHLKYDLATDVRRLQDHARELDLPDRMGQATELRQRIEGHHFSVAVVGEFKRGKSTFINALLGQEILPSDIMPTSATLNRVTYGVTKSVTVSFKDDRAPEKIAIEQLADYVTKLTPEAEAMAATIEEATVAFPVPYCKNDVDIIDTPGLSDEAAMTSVTMRVLPRTDAAILVIMADSPFSSSEGEFLEHLLGHGLSRVLFVVTALDRIRKLEDRPRVLEDIRRRIDERIHEYADSHYEPGSEDHTLFLRQSGNPRVYGISGYDALIGKETHDLVLLEGSGFNEFEQSLERFLTSSDAMALERRLKLMDQLCADLLEAVDERVRALPQRRLALESDLSVLGSMLDAMEQFVVAEVRQLTTVSGQTIAAVSPSLEEHRVSCKQTVRRTLNNKDSKLTPTGHKGFASFTEGLTLAISAGLDNHTRQLADDICQVFTSSLLDEWERVHQVAIAGDRLLAFVESRIHRLRGKNRRDNDEVSTPSLCDELGVRTGFEAMTSPGGEQGDCPTPDVKKLAQMLGRYDRDIKNALDSVEVARAVALPKDSGMFARKTWEYSLAGKFQQAAGDGIIAELEKTLDATPPRKASQQWMDRAIDTISAPLSQYLTRLRESRTELVVLRQRLDVFIEKDLEDFEEAKVQLASIQDRARQLGHDLGNAGI